MQPILQELDAQWREIADTPTSRRAVRAWAAQYPCLAGFSDLHGFMACRRDPDVVHDVLLCLARLAPRDELAARTILQMLLPGIVRLVGTVGRGDPDARDDLVGLAWERIRTYPTSRNGSVAANVVLDVRKQYLRQRRQHDVIALGAMSEPVANTPTPEDDVLGVLLVEEIVAAQRAGLMSEAVLSTIMRTRLGGERLADLAAEQNLDPQLLCLRRWRAERKLRELPLAG